MAQNKQTRARSNGGERRDSNPRCHINWPRQGNTLISVLRDRTKKSRMLVGTTRQSATGHGWETGNEAEHVCYCHRGDLGRHVLDVTGATARAAADSAGMVF